MSEQSKRLFTLEKRLEDIFDYIDKTNEFIDKQNKIVKALQQENSELHWQIQQHGLEVNPYRTKGLFLQ